MSITKTVHDRMTMPYWAKIIEKESNIFGFWFNHHYTVRLIIYAKRGNYSFLDSISETKSFKDLENAYEWIRLKLEQNQIYDIWYLNNRKIMTKSSRSTYFDGDIPEKPTLDYAEKYWDWE